jgi:hypothetical protein
LAVSAGACNAGGRIGVVAAAFGFAPPALGAVIWAKAAGWAAPKVTDIKATDINVAVSIDLMTHPGTIEARPIKHICLVGNNRVKVQGYLGNPSSPRNGFAVVAGGAAIGRVSKDDVHLRWFETRAGESNSRC